MNTLHECNAVRNRCRDLALALAAAGHQEEDVGAATEAVAEAAELLLAALACVRVAVARHLDSASSAQ
eukprot:3813-Heterococcus_DN1.PRE.1